MCSYEGKGSFIAPLRTMDELHLVTEQRLYTYKYIDMGLLKILTIVLFILTTSSLLLVNITIAIANLSGLDYILWNSNGLTTLPSQFHLLLYLSNL